MSQLNTTCDVVNSSNTITFPSGTDLSPVIQGSLVLVGTDAAAYYVASVNDLADTLQITAPYAGNTSVSGVGTGTSVVVHNSFTSTQSIAYPEAGDTRNITIIKDAILRITEKFLPKEDLFAIEGTTSSLAPAANSTFTLTHNLGSNVIANIAVKGSVVIDDWACSITHPNSYNQVFRGSGDSNTIIAAAAAPATNNVTLRIVNTSTSTQTISFRLLITKLDFGY